MGTARTYANRYFTCDECGRWITGHGYVSITRWANVPCGHQADSHSACRTWSPVDGCQCTDPKPHGEPGPFTLEFQAY
jgi:hypothetical protein